MIYFDTSYLMRLYREDSGGFGEIYSNDRHLLAAAPHFGLRGVNIISAG